jgi:hypothetical protein
MFVFSLLLFKIYINPILQYNILFDSMHFFPHYVLKFKESRFYTKKKYQILKNYIFPHIYKIRINPIKKKQKQQILIFLLYISC